MIRRNFTGDSWIVCKNFEHAAGPFEEAYVPFWSHIVLEISRLRRKSKQKGNGSNDSHTSIDRYYLDKIFSFPFFGFNIQTLTHSDKWGDFWYCCSVTIRNSIHKWCSSNDRGRLMSQTYTVCAHWGLILPLLLTRKRQPYSTMFVTNT